MIHFLHQLLILEHGWNSSKKMALQSFQFLNGWIPTSYGWRFHRSVGTLGWCGCDILEPDPWTDPFFTRAHVGLVLCSQPAPARIHPAPGQSQTWMQKGELQNQTLVPLFVRKEARSKSRAANALLFELLSKMHFSQNNLIVYFLGWIVLYLLMSIKLMFSENGPTWLAGLFAEHQLV